MHYSGRLPLLVATLANERPNDLNSVDDPSDTAVARFLRWIEGPRKRQVALNAALPRQFNRDILAEMGEEGKNGDVLFFWLVQMPFVEKYPNGWAYHEVVRAQMLRYKQCEAPQEWTALHEKLANYYEKLRDTLELTERQKQHNSVWQDLALEGLYHRLCQSPHTFLGTALNGFFTAFRTQGTFVYRWAQTIQQAGQDSGMAELQQWGRRLIVGMKAQEKNNLKTVAEMLSALLESHTLETKGGLVALIWRSIIHLQLEQYTEALVDLDQFIKMKPTDAEAFALRGVVHYNMGHQDRAIADSKRAARLAQPQLCYIHLDVARAIPDWPPHWTKKLWSSEMESTLDDTEEWK